MLFWLHAILALITVFSWIVVGRNGWIIMLHKRATTYRSLPLLVRTHIRTGTICAGLTALVIVTGYSLPSFSGLAATVHRWSAGLALPAIALGFYCGWRTSGNKATSPFAHVGLLFLSSLIGLLTLCSGCLMVIRTW